MECLRYRVKQIGYRFHDYKTCFSNNTTIYRCSPNSVKKNFDVQYLESQIGICKVSIGKWLKSN